ncbi:MAG: cytochrome C [Alphaproteobacteria bacterium]|nr:cytochrome C [Alphaproteobacteria bacterium]
MGGFLVSPGVAHAVPSFATQTGQPCAACHVGAFGPQLTPFGRDFKLNGYTMTDGNKHGLPVSLMLQSSFTNTKKDNSSPTHGFGPNNNFSLDQISAFYAGALTEHAGAFIQATYDGVANSFAWDNADIRYAHPFTIAGQDVVAGVSLNNTPTVQDLWNTTPAWGFPYSSSALANTPSASPLIGSDGLNQQVLGTTAYADIDGMVYVEGGAYHGLSGNIRNTLGEGINGTNTYQGLIPYWRVALQHDFNDAHYFEIGTYGLTANVYPSGVTSGGTDHYVDNAVDATYQWHADPDNFVSAHMSYMHEDRNLKATLAGSANTDQYLNQFKADVSYSYKNTWTPSLQYFKTTGSADAVDSLSSPNSEGFTAELAYVPFGKADSPMPWFNGRVALQYTGYTQYNGTSTNASDNNTVFLNLWLTLDPVAPFYEGK